MPGRPLCKNSLCMIHSSAQHKVYEPIRTSVRLHAGGWHTRAGHRFFPSVVAEHALLTARADRAAGRCTILCWYRIDHSTSLAQRRSAREESEPDPAWPSVASPLRMDLPGILRRMYLLSSNALRVSHRVLTTTRRRRVTVSWSGRHGCAVTEAAGKGNTRMSHEP